MSKNIMIVLGLLVLGTGIYFGTMKKDDKMMGDDIAKGDIMQKDHMTDDGSLMKDDKMMKDAIQKDTMSKDAMMTKGSYESYSPEKIMKTEKGNVVLFFHASWCPSCIFVDKDIKSNLTNIPSNLTILDVNYDNSAELKKKYGVTYQHTFVQVDKDGNMIKKWSGSPTLAKLVSEIK